MKFIFELLLAALPSLFNPIIRLVKLEILAVYMRGVDGARRAFILGLCALFLVMLAIASFVLIHVAVFLLIPWSTQTGAFVMLGLGIFYLCLSAIFVVKLCSKRTWMKISGAETFARSISRDD
jgi:hypothetical protein